VKGEKRLMKDKKRRARGGKGEGGYWEEKWRVCQKKKERSRSGEIISNPVRMIFPISPEQQKKEGRRRKCIEGGYRPRYEKSRFDKHKKPENYNSRQKKPFFAHKGKRLWLGGWD